MKYWIGVASKEHVAIGVAGGFAQLCHGKKAPLARMKVGDYLFYYAPKISLQSKEPYQKIIALGQVTGKEIYSYEMAPGFIPFRRDVHFVKSLHEVTLKQLNQLPEWQSLRSRLRFGHFEISENLCQQICHLMACELP